MPIPQTSLPKPTPYETDPRALIRKGKMKFTIELDIDLVHVAEDQATCQGMTLAQWVQFYANDSLRALLFG